MTPPSSKASSFVAVLALTWLAACAGTKGDQVDSGASGPPDAAPGTPDAAPGTPDAAPPDASTGVPCSSGDVCAGAISLGTISGDTGNMKLTAQDYQSAWYVLRAKEDSNGSVPVRVAAKLTSPATADFDVFLYVNVNNDVAQECTTTIGTPSSAGNVDTVKAEWSDVFASDESRNVTVEVRAISGTCSVGEIWQLEIEGNWQ